MLCSSSWRASSAPDRVCQLGAGQRLVVALGLLGGRREARLGSCSASTRPAGNGSPASVPCATVLGPAGACQVAAHHALDVQALARLTSMARPARRSRWARRRAARQSGRRSGSGSGRCCPSRSNQNAESVDSTMPLPGIGSRMTTSKADRRSVATISSSSPRS